LQILSSPIFWSVLVVHLLSDGFPGLCDLDRLLGFVSFVVYPSFSVLVFGLSLVAFNPDLFVLISLLACLCLFVTW
jgi:hypothetical protein